MSSERQTGLFVFALAIVGGAMWVMRGMEIERREAIIAARHEVLGEMVRAADDRDLARFDAAQRKLDRTPRP